MNPIADTIAGILKPVADVVDKYVGDKAALQMAVVQGQINAAAAVMGYEQQLLGAQSDAIKAEAQGGSWIQRNWRPITMLTFLVLVVCDSFKWLPNPLAPEAWTLLQLGLGGYVAGRSAEKIAPVIAGAIKAASGK